MLRTDQHQHAKPRRFIRLKRFVAENLLGVNRRGPRAMGSGDLEQALPSQQEGQEKVEDAAHRSQRGHPSFNKHMSPPTRSPNLFATDAELVSRAPNLNWSPGISARPPERSAERQEHRILCLCRFNGAAQLMGYRGTVLPRKGSRS